MTDLRSLAPILDPTRVAVVGASPTEGSPGNVIWRNLASFPGERVPVSRTVSVLDGVAAYESLRDVPGTIDLAIIAVPAEAVLGVVRDAVDARVRACVIVSAGFAELGPEGRARQAEILQVARTGGVLLVGPNCLGVQNCDIPLNASLAGGTATGGGGISVLTQSGSYSMALHAMSADDGIGFAVAYSSGNSCDVDDAEVIDYLGRDSRTRVICAFLESVGDGPLFLEVLRRTTAVKPVIVTAVGRSEAGARAAASHTAALAADRRAWDDLLCAVGAIVADSGLEMLDTARALAGQPLPKGVRAAIVTNSGGTGTELSDLLAREGIEVPELSFGLRERIDAMLPNYASSANPIDITPVWSRFADLYPAVVELLARSGEVDLVIPILLHRSAENAAVASGLVRVVDDLRADGNDVPVYACWVARRSAWPVTAILHAAGIPALEWPARTARAVGHAVRYGLRRLKPVLPEPAPTTRRELPAGVGDDSLVTQAFLRANGIPVIDTVFCSTAAEAREAAEGLGFPVVVKIDHPGLLHKTDAGGVRLGLADADAVERAAASLLGRVDDVGGLSGPARVALQRQWEGLELLVGGLREATFGPVVAVGLGGVLVEALDEVAFAPAPLEEAEAAALVFRTRAGRLMEGFRGRDAVDPMALGAVVAAVGDLMATYPEIEEIDLNPVMADHRGVTAVDVRLLRSADGNGVHSLKSARRSGIREEGP